MDETFRTILSATVAGVLTILIVSLWNRISGWVKERLVGLVPILGRLLTGLIVAVMAGLFVMNWNATQFLERAVISNTERIVTELASKGVTRRFGKWVMREPDTVYPAESDGFAGAYTGGDNPSDEFTIDVGFSQDQLHVLTRGLRYDGSVTPVPRGSYWKVNSQGSSGTIVVWWLPVLE